MSILNCYFVVNYAMSLTRQSKLCNNCAYFLTTNFKLETNPTKHLGKCMYFRKNMIDGVLDYHYAIDIRNNATLCGSEGRFFESHTFTTEYVFSE